METRSWAGSGRHIVGDVEVQFTRCGRNVRVVVYRDDGVSLETTTTTVKRGLLPHDLEHFVVENAVELTSGLWGRIAAGAEFRSFVVTTSKPRRKPRSHGRALTRGMTGWDENIIDVVVGCYRAARAAGWAPPAKLPTALPIERQLARAAGTVERDFTRADVERACVALHETCEAWASTTDGETLRLKWTVRKTFATTSRKRK